jgi:hypothetical protein
MKKHVMLLGAFLSLTLVATAQKYEAFLGYDFVQFNSASTIIPSNDANGGDSQFVYQLNRWVGAVLDVGAVNMGTLNHYSIDSTVANFVAGPRFTWHNKSRFRPFAQVLFGGTYAATSTRLDILGGELVTPPGAVQPIYPLPVVESPNVPLSVRLVSSQAGFAMLAGGGLDIKLRKRIAFRPIGVDYYLTRLPDILSTKDTNRNNFRYTCGFNFMLGKGW